MSESETSEPAGITGGCHCGAITYVAHGAPEHHALCHCGDCRRSAGAPMVGWIAFREGQVAVTGTPLDYASSEHGRRSFCGTCGTGLFYRNADFLPSIIDIQSATLDNPAVFAPGVHIQTAERLAWTRHLKAMPEFEHYPG